MILSSILVRIGVIDIDRKFEHCFGAVVLGIGEITARFHQSGTVDVGLMID